MRQNIFSIEDFHIEARRRLPRAIFDILEGGALDEITLRENQEQLNALKLRQRVLVDVETADLSTTVLGQRIELPLMVSPLGLLNIIKPGADIALAQAATAVGSIFIHSAWSSTSLEEIVKVAPHNTWAQISFWEDESITHDHIARAKEAGIQTLVIAGDVALTSKRERDLRHGMSNFPPKLPLRDLVDFALKPSWLWRWFIGSPLTLGNYRLDGKPIPTKKIHAWMDANESKRANWKQFAQLRSEWSGKLVIKGIMNVEDARRAVSEGADGIFVSNHGGRQFDGQPATISVLPAIVDTVQGAAEVFMDGGIRRGSDILKAVSYGARAALVGRPLAYALASGGQEGVTEAYKILQDELRIAMGFTGVNSISNLDRSVLHI